MSSPSFTAIIIIIITLAAAISALYFGLIGPRKHRNGWIFFLSTVVLTITSVIVGRTTTEARLGEKLYDNVDETIPSDKTPYYAVVIPTCLYSEPDEYSECRITISKDAIIYVYGVHNQIWMRARTVAPPDSTDSPQEIGWVNTKFIEPAPYPGNIYFSSIVSQIVSRDDLFLNLLEISLGVAVMQFFKRRQKIMSVIVSIPFTILTLWHGLRLYGVILDYRIRDIEFFNWLQIYPIIVVLSIFFSNAIVDFLIDWFSGKTLLIMTPKKRRYVAFIIGTVVLFSLFILLAWAGRYEFHLSTFMVPYSPSELNLQLIDFERNPVASALFIGGLLLIGLFGWLEGNRLRQSPENTVKRIGIYFMMSYLFQLPAVLAVSLLDINEPFSTILSHSYWISSVVLWFWLGWDVIFTYIGQPDYMRTPVPLLTKERVCMRCEQVIRYEKEKITGHDPACPWTPDPTADGLFKKCLELIEQKKWDVAANVLRAATESHPNYIKFAAYYGKVLIELGEIDKALEVLSSKIGLDPLPSYYWIYTDGLIAKAKLDEKFKEALLADAKETLKHDKASQNAQAIIRELMPPEPAPMQKESRIRDRILGQNTSGLDPGTLKGIQPLLMDNEEVLHIIVQVPLAGFSPDSFVLTNKRYILYRPGVLGRMNFRDYLWHDLSDAHLREGVLWAWLWFKSRDGRKLSLGMLPKEPARMIYRFAQSKEELNSSQSSVDHKIKTPKSKEPKNSDNASNSHD